MSKADEFKKKDRKKTTRNELPVLDSDQDYIKVFLSSSSLDEGGGCSGAGGSEKGSFKKTQLNRHGLPIIDSHGMDSFTQGDKGGHVLSEDENETEDELACDPGTPEEFYALLEASLKQGGARSGPKPSPMPLKRRLKRYPGPETQLDLHGFTAAAARIKARSFIVSCKQQGFFTIRLIVGKGLHSQDGPVLPDVIEDLLKVLRKEQIILAYEWDRKKKDRSGALIVYIKQFSN